MPYYNNVRSANWVDRLQESVWRTVTRITWRSTDRSTSSKESASIRFLSRTDGAWVDLQLYVCPVETTDNYPAIKT